MRAMTVAVIGGGASGTLSAAHLAQTAALAGVRLQLLLIDPAEPGRGVAYSTTELAHRLNVPARGMSAWPQDGEHFLRWLRAAVSPQSEPGEFAPRPHYARYLREVLDQAVTGADGVRLQTLRTHAQQIHSVAGRLSVRLATDATASVDAVVLATGHGAPATQWAPPTLRRSPRFVADPWAAELPVLPRSGTALLVGAGLTMADVARKTGRDGATLHVLSRHGMLPLAHAAEPQPPLPMLLPAGDVLTAAELRRLVFAHVRVADGDWRRAVDGLRPITAQLWSRLPDTERTRLVAHSGRRWDRVRHRVDPEVGAWLHDRQASGELHVHAGSVADAQERDGHLQVRTSSGAVIDADLVINCTGPTGSVRGGAGLLVADLVAHRLAMPGPLELGLATDAAGRLRTDTGPAPAIWTLGPLRRGELWESTAVPEIRAQAAVLAENLLAHLIDGRSIDGHSIDGHSGRR